MKLIKTRHIRGFNHNHGTKYTVTDLQRSAGPYTVEAGVNRLPRRDSKFWDHGRFMIWDTEGNFQYRRSRRTMNQR